MADIAPNRQKINDIEASNDAPITTQLLTKMGANLNDYLNKGCWLEVFDTVGGPYTWTNPTPDITKWAIILGCGGGGGGGGAGGPRGSGDDNTAGGGGGAGSEIQSIIIPVSTSLTINIGAGGVGGAAGPSGGGFPTNNQGSDGANGGDSVITGPSIGEIRFYGGEGGRGGNGADYLTYIYPSNNYAANGKGGGLTETFRRPCVLGGDGGYAFTNDVTDIGGGNYQYAFANSSLNGAIGSRSYKGGPGVGGAAGLAVGGSGFDRGTGGGGGGGSWGNGGAGGNTSVNGAAGGIGAGGGGGGGTLSISNAPGAGGNGGAGMVRILWWGDE